MRSLESKGFLTHKDEGGRFTYFPSNPRQAVARTEIARLLTSFFGGSVTAAVATMIDQERDRLTDRDIAELRAMIDKAAEDGR